MFASNLSISSQFTPLQPKIAKKLPNTPIFRVQTSKSIKVINIDNPKKLVASACYVKQHVCAYLQPFLR